MKHIRNILSLLVLVSCVLSAQDDLDFPSLNTNDIPGGNILQSNYFDGNALWGHIDGGADLYLEYGFDKLLFQEINWNGMNFRVEYYRMKDAEAAFGVYSISHFKCKMTDTLSKYVCITAYQAQCALGRFYISIANEKGDKQAEMLSLELFQKILNNSKEKLFELPELFLNGKLANYKSSVKFIKGKLGLQNGFPNWEEMFSDISGFSLYVLPIEHAKDYLNAAQIKFSSSDDAKTFLVKNKIGFEKEKTFYKSVENSNSKIFHLIGPTQIVFYETNNEKMLD